MKSTAFCSTLADSVHPSQELRLPLSPGQWKAGCTRCEQRDTGAIEQHEQPKVLNESFVIFVGKICHYLCAAYLFQRTMGFAKFHLAHWRRIKIKLSAQVFASQCCLRRTVRGTAGVSPMKQLLRLCRILRHYAKRSGPNTSRRAHAPGMGRQFLHMTRPAVHSGIMAPWITMVWLFFEISLTYIDFLVFYCMLGRAVVSSASRTWETLQRGCSFVNCADCACKMC